MATGSSGTSPPRCCPASSRSATGSIATDTQYLRVYVGLLRQKIEADPADPQLLLTEPGVGYRLVASDI
jgi:DNA-binding response OmpR family regulator